MATQPRPALQLGKWQVELRGPVLWLVRAILLATIAGIAWKFPPWRHGPMWLAASGWVGFSIYWGAASRNSAESKSTETVESRRVHVLLTNIGQALLFISVPGLRLGFLPSASSWTAPWTLVGLTFLAASIALAVWARRHLGRNWSGRIEIKTDHELVRTGPYRVLRHPIYTAVIGMCAGTALVDGEVHALVGVAMVLAAYWRKVRMEEAKLREAFGSGYNEYRRRTLGAVPGVF